MTVVARSRYVGRKSFLRLWLFRLLLWGEVNMRHQKLHKFERMGMSARVGEDEARIKTRLAVLLLQKK
jgi:hypothetical protein